MADLFGPIWMFRNVPPVTIDGLDRYAPGTALAGTWQTPFGGPARTSRSAEPLVHDAWSVKWEAPLGDAARPDSVLVGPDLIVVNGESARGIWDRNGARVGGASRAGGSSSYLDVKGGRLIGEDPDGGLSVFALPGGKREAAISLSAPEDHTTKEVLEGPGGVVVLVTAHESPFGPSPDVVVEAIRIRDYNDTGKHKILYGFDPVGGIVREEDGYGRAAAARGGPVIATRGGILWCDWRLGSLAAYARSATPAALSVDDQDRACMICEDEDGRVRLLVVPPGGPAALEIELPASFDRMSVPPILGADGSMYLTPRGSVLALAPTGDELWRQERASAAPGLLTSNGLLLLADDQLYAVTRDGRRLPLWKPPAPIQTAAVLAGGLLHVATAETLFVLAPSAP
jgi:hypothetical protein